MSNTFYVARTDGLDVVVGGARSDRRRTEDAAAVHERRTAARSARKDPRKDFTPPRGTRAPAGWRWHLRRRLPRPA
jgi:hypothetical protein